MYHITKYFAISNNIFASVFKYDRWNQILFLELESNLNINRGYLCLSNCHYVKFNPEVKFGLNNINLSQYNDYYIIKIENYNFSAKFKHLTKWSDEQYLEYYMNLHTQESELEKGSQRKLVQSIREFKKILSATI